MSRWFRHYAGLCRDDKLVSVAIKSRQPIERVVWVWCAILESAAEIDDEGRYRLDAAEVSYFLRADEAEICAVEAGLAVAGRVADGAVVKWGNRQFRSDRSAERVAAHRERKRSGGDQREHREASQNGVVTLQERHCNSPELETETERTEANASVSRTKAKKSAIKTDWSPSESGFASAAKRNLSGEALSREITRFVNHHVSKGNLMANWDAAWVTWLDSPYRQIGPAPPGRAQRNNRSMLDGLDEIERRFADERPAYPRLAV